MCNDLTEIYILRLNTAILCLSLLYINIEETYLCPYLFSYPQFNVKKNISKSSTVLSVLVIDIT